MTTVCFKVSGCIDGDVHHLWPECVKFEANLYGATNMRSARKLAAKCVNRLTLNGKLHLHHFAIIRILI